MTMNFDALSQQACGFAYRHSRGPAQIVPRLHPDLAELHQGKRRRRAVLRMIASIIERKGARA
jgi:hypothetical protein